MLFWPDLHQQDPNHRGQSLMKTKRLPQTKFNVTDYVKYFRNSLTHDKTIFKNEIRKGWITEIEFRSDENGNVTHTYVITDNLGASIGYLISEDRIIKRVRRPRRDRN